MRQQAKEGKKESEQLTKKKGHERADRETEGGRRWDKSFQEHHRGLDVSCHLTCGNFTPHQVGREGTNMRRGVRRVAGQDWKTFFFFFWGAKKRIQAEKEGLYVCACASLQLQHDLWVSPPMSPRTTDVMGARLSKEQAYFHHTVLCSLFFLLM